ncbi:MAG: AAA family ATPase [Candidatus Levybacteria bacterium]|nr:AAA family ATPase [Candidatus Levybacteria bacterium]
MSNIKLSEEQRKLFNKLENSTANIFITGKAGTGKSILLQYFKQNSKKKLVVVAPTGVAALNVGGQTIHSLFRIPPSFIAKNSLMAPDSKTTMLLRNIDAIVIDEISMVRADLMDAIDHRLRQAHSNNFPFGGIQIIMFGDLYQLPPVVSDPELHKYFADNHDGYYFFNAHVWNNSLPEIYELKYIFRQEDEVFRKILNAIRTKDLSEQVLLDLNGRSKVSIPVDGVVILATTNSSVNEINQNRLAQLEGKEYEYRAIISGNLERSSFPTEEILHLKKGAQVMFLRNDRSKRWVNGTLGKIHSLSEKEVKVSIDGIVYPVLQETWKKIKYYYDRQKHSVEEEIISSFTQIPLRLAWAITIHKSQGQTYKAVAVDMGSGAFAHGQTYVALSRCKSLEGLYLKREISREDIIVDTTVINFMNKVNMQE